MPCDGIAVATLQVGVGKEILSTPEAMQAVATLLAKTHQVSVAGPDILKVDGVPVRITHYGTISGQVSQATLEEIKNACTAVAGVLTQEKVANEISKKAVVTERQYASNGYLALKVNF